MGPGEGHLGHIYPNPWTVFYWGVRNLTEGEGGWQQTQLFREAASPGIKKAENIEFM